MSDEYIINFYSTENESKEDRDLKENEFKKHFSRNLSAHLKAADISTSKLSKLTGYTIQHCSNMKKGTTVSKAPSLFCLYRICTAINISPEDIWNTDQTLHSPTDEDIINIKKKKLINIIEKLDNQKIIDKLLNDVDFLKDLSGDNSSEDSKDVIY